MPKFANVSVDPWSLKGQMFAELYYHVFDHRRHELVKLYQPTAGRCYNGNGVSGEAELLKHFSAFPDSSHTVQELEVQPVAYRPDSTTMLIVASGRVQYELEEPFRFSQSLVVQMDRTDNAFVVLTDSCRTTLE